MKLSDVLHEIILPAIAQDPGAFREFGWRREGGCWRATSREVAERYGVAQPRRIVLSRRKDGSAPDGFYVFGMGHVSWFEHLGHARAPKGAEFRRALEELASRVGVAIPGPVKGESAEDKRIRERAEAERLEGMRARAAAREAEQIAREREVREILAMQARQLFEAVGGRERNKGVNHPAARCYLNARGIDLDALGPLPASLRTLSTGARIDYAYGESGESKSLRGPVICGACIDGQGQVCAVQRIYLDPRDERRKRDLTSPKLALGALAGAACPLKATPATEGPLAWTLIVCEGIETGLAILASCGGASAGPAVWSAISANGLTGLSLPPRVLECVKVVIVAGDYDRLIEPKEGQTFRPYRTGRRFAERAAELLREAHPRLDVRVAIPSHATCPSLIDENGEILIEA